jgi:SAM-dependent methyltransferase
LPDGGLEYVACNLCGSDEHGLVYRMPDAQFHPDEWFDVVECRSCGLGFVNPRPPFHEMGRYYPPSYYDYFEAESEFHERRYAEQARFLAPVHARTTPRLLDVGCANGAFPRFMRARGWSVEGVEVSDVAREIDDFPVYRSDFPSIPVSSPAYDAVTAWAVLEHVHDPMAYFRKAAEVLEPEGLFVFHVTNFSSLSSRTLYHEDVPRHLYFFTEETVRRYAVETGFFVDTVDYSNRIYGMHPSNWLVYNVAYRPWRRRFTWEAAQNSREEFARRRGLSGTRATVAFAMRHPLVTLDRVTTPLYARLQMARRTYGVATYVARRNGEG